MPDFRVHCLPPEPEPAELRLDADESHHLVTVNRARIGDRVVAFDGSGTEWICELVDDARRSAVLKVCGRQHASRPPAAISIAQSLPKGQLMDAIVRKATELGVAQIIPLLSDRSIARLDDERQDRKAARWRTASIEAAKQCGNPFLPGIAPLQELGAFLAGAGSHDVKLIACLHSHARPLKTVLSHHAAAAGRPPASVLALIGPEGDFTPDEVAAARAHGFTPVSLGPLVLRCETAAVYVISVLSHELNG